MKILDKRQVRLLHQQLIEASGGSPGLRDEGLLESALSAPFQSFAGTSAYPSLQQKAARLGYGLVKNHPFVDGNKRTGAHVMLVFLAVNGVELRYKKPSWMVRYRAATQPPSTRNRRRSISCWRVLAEGT